MVLSIDFVAKRYGRLPSEVMTAASTFDLYVADVAVQYQNYLYDKENKKHDAKTSVKDREVPQLTQEVMNQMIETARKRNATKNRHKSV
jgi:hypothetical protein